MNNPPTPSITAGAVTAPTSCSSADGSIAFTSSNLPNGSYTLNYTGTGAVATAGPKVVTITGNAFTLSALDDGTYSNFSISHLGCTASDATSKTVNNPAAPTLTVGLATNPSVCSGSDGSIAFTTTLVNGTYTLNYTGAGNPQNVTVVSGAFNLTGLSAGTFSAFSISNAGCTSNAVISKTLTDPSAPTLTAGLATNPTTCASTDGSIAFTTSLANGTYTLNYTGSGSPKNITVTSGVFTLTGLPDGTFSGFSVTASGCTGIDNTSKTLTDPSAPTLTVGLATNPTTCISADGSIAFTTNLPNGTYSLSYTGSGSPQNIAVLSGAFNLTGLPDGIFSGFSVTTGGCTGTTEISRTLTAPTAPTLTAGLATNPTTCLSADGSIAFTTNLPNGTYSLNYTGTGSPKSITVVGGAFTLTGLPDGTFSGFSVTTGGCTGIDNASKTLTAPAAPTLTVGLATKPTTCLSADGSIAFTTNLPNGTYSLSYTGSGSPQNITVLNGAFTLGNLPDGIFSGFSVTTGGCTGTSETSRTLTTPAAPTLTVGLATNPTTCLSADGTIAFITNLPNGTYSLSYTGSGSPKNITVLSGAFTLTGLPDGTFSGFSVTTGGCTGIDNTSKTLTDPAAPTITAGLTTNPSTCAGINGNIAFSTTLPNGTYTLNYTGSGSPKSITVTSGSFTLTDLPAGVYNGFSVTTGGCTGIDNTTKNLTDPVAPTITVGTSTNPTTCSGTDGSIAFSSTNLPNGTYSLIFTGTGATGGPKSVTVSGALFNLTGLSAGTYSNFSITNAGCTGTNATSKTLTDPNAPIATANSNSPICAGNTLNLTSGNGGALYQWSGPNGFASTQQNPDIINATAEATGIYTVTVTGANGCTATATANVSVSPLPNTSISGSENLTCTTSSVTRTASGGVSYAWSNGLGNNALVNISTAGTYTVTVTGANGCTATATTIVTNDGTLPNAQISGTDNLSCSVTSVTRTASGGVSYAWSNGLGTNASVNISAVGTYTITVTGTNGCTATATTTVSSINNLIATATNTGPYLIGNTIELNATGGSNYSWTGPNNFTSNLQNPTIPNALGVNAGIYTVTVTNGACSASATTNVIINIGIDPCIPIVDYQFVKAGNPYQPLFSLTNEIKINQLAEEVSIIAVPICPSISIESLNMTIQGPSANFSIIQSVSPYALFDNFGTNVYGQVLAPGVYTLTVTGYTQDNLQGSINYGPVTTTFTILPNTANINMPTFSSTSICSGSNMDVTFTTNGVFNPNNQFRVELSNANGSFGSTALVGNASASSSFVYPTIIGTSSLAGTISCTIPNTTEGGTNYRIRVVSTDGVSISPVASNALTIHPKDLNFVSPTDDFSVNAGIKQASQKIIASNKVISPANVTYQAGKAIVLNAGFEVNSGTVFKAEIQGCGN